MKYQIVSHWTTEGLEGKVNFFLKRGWEPMGGVAVVMSSTYGVMGKLSTEYLQALIKKD